MSYLENAESEGSQSLFLPEATDLFFFFFFLLSLAYPGTRSPAGRILLHTDITVSSAKHALVTTQFGETLPELLVIFMSYLENGESELVFD